METTTAPVVKKWITGIIVKEKGVKGLDVEFSHQEEKGGKTWIVGNWQERKMPIGDKLADVIKAFRFYLLDIYGYDMDSVNQADCTIKEITFGGDICIVGEMRILNGDRYAPLKAKKINEESEYDKLDELQKLVGQLKDEIQDYIDGKSIMSEKQFVIEFYKGKKGFKEEDVAGLSEEEILEKYTKALEKTGAVVLRPGDIGKTEVAGLMEDNFGTEEHQEEPVQNEMPVIEQEKKETHVVQGNFGGEAPVLNFESPEPEKALVENEGDEDNMVLHVTPVKTA